MQRRHVQESTRRRRKAQSGAGKHGRHLPAQQLFTGVARLALNCNCEAAKARSAAELNASKTGTFILPLKKKECETCLPETARFLTPNNTNREKDSGAILQNQTQAMRMATDAQGKAPEAS